MTQPLRILLVENDWRDVEITRAVLAATGLAIDLNTVGDGAAALDYLYRRQAFAKREDIAPSLVLLDIKMPKISGVEVLQHLKSDPALRSIPVVMLTSSIREQDLLAAYEFQANGYLVKPITAPQLLKTIEAAVNPAADRGSVLYP